MQIAPVALHYTLDPQLDRRTLKEWAYCFIDQQREEQLAQWMEKSGIGALYMWDSYHRKLSSILSSPLIIYYRGDIWLLDDNLLAVVWPRRASSYAKQVVDDLMKDARDYELGVISGGADGIDKHAHRLAMQYGLPTVVVLGAGLAQAMRSRDREFLDTVVEAGGLVLSEFRLKQVPSRWTFPQRNRIIAGLADAVFVPAAGEKSGSLITVDFALQMHKDVYSVPGSIYDTWSKWSNAYIATQSIRALVDWSELLERHFVSSGRKSLSFSPEELREELRELLIALRGVWSARVAELVPLVERPLRELLVDLTELEMEGFVYEDKPGIYCAT